MCDVDLVLWNPKLHSCVAHLATRAWRRAGVDRARALSWRAEATDSREDASVSLYFLYLFIAWDLLFI